MALNRANKIKGMGMPKKPAAEEAAMNDLDLELAEADEEGLDELAELAEGEEEVLEDDAEMEEMDEDSELDAIDDELLIKEMKKRGLSLEAAEEEELENDLEL